VIVLDNLIISSLKLFSMLLLSHALSIIAKRLLVGMFVYVLVMPNDASFRF